MKKSTFRSHFRSKNKNDTAQFKCQHIFPRIVGSCQVKERACLTNLGLQSAITEKGHTLVTPMQFQKQHMSSADNLHSRTNSCPEEPLASGEAKTAQKQPAPPVELLFGRVR